MGQHTGDNNLSNSQLIKKYVSSVSDLILELHEMVSRYNTDVNIFLLLVLLNKQMTPRSQLRN